MVRRRSNTAQQTAITVRVNCKILHSSDFKLKLCILLGRANTQFINLVGFSELTAATRSEHLAPNVIVLAKGTESKMGNSWL